MIIGGLLGVSALIHILPLSGVLGRERLKALYGVAIDDPTTLLAMRHRAVLFGCLGAFLVAAIFVAELRIAAVVTVGLADLGFLVLALATPGKHPAMKKVVIADVVSLVVLAGALVDLLLLA